MNKEPFAEMPEEERRRLAELAEEERENLEKMREEMPRPEVPEGGE